MPPRFLFNGRDLSKQSLDPDPTHSGRRIAKILFGDRGDCELIDAMIDPDFSRHPNRIATDASKVETLKSKILKTVKVVSTCTGKCSFLLQILLSGLTEERDRLALRTSDMVKSSSNQMRRDLKRDYPRAAARGSSTPASNRNNCMRDLMAARK